MTTPFGPIVAPPNVEDAVVNHLRRWVGVYLGKLEDLNGLARGSLYRPPCDGSFYGGVDFDSYLQAELPAFIVTVEPLDQPMHTSSTGYGQVYAVGIAVVVILEGEDESRRMAGFQGAAAMAAMVQVPDLGAGTVIEMASSPKVVLPDPDVRRIARCQAIYHVLVDQVVNDLFGPAPGEVPDDHENPEEPWPEWPTIESVELTAIPEEPT